MKHVKIEELKRNPYYSNGFLIGQREIRGMAIRRVMNACEGRPLRLKEWLKVCRLNGEMDGINRIINERRGADRDAFPLVGSPAVIDIKKHGKRKQ